jgi:hypothetical protein
MEDKNQLFYQTVASLFAVTLLSALLLRTFSNPKDNSPLVRTITFTGWFLGLSTLAVLRVDIALSQEEAVKTTARMTTFWRSFYWSSFTLSHLVVPVLMNYERAVHLVDVKERVKFAAIQVLQRYLLYVALGLSALAIAWGFFGARLSSPEERVGFWGTVMAVASAFSLFQIIVFLGYGLVNIPKHFWCNSSLERQYRFSLFQVD